MGGHNKVKIGVKKSKKCKVTPPQFSTEEYHGMTKLYHAQLDILEGIRHHHSHRNICYTTDGEKLFKERFC